MESSKLKERWFYFDKISYLETFLVVGRKSYSMDVQGKNIYKSIISKSNLSFLYRYQHPNEFIYPKYSKIAAKLYPNHKYFDGHLVKMDDEFYRMLMDHEDFRGTGVFTIS